jgi:predicted DNA-binding transcriptional regulator AlpA
MHYFYKGNFMNNMNELKPTQWLADKLGVSISTIERWRARGEHNLPPHIQLGGVIRYDEREVEAWIQTRMQSGNVSQTNAKNQTEQGVSK